MKNTISFCVGALSLMVRQMKPFNPILGETFQAQYPNGEQLFLEHTSHHPPISNFLLEGRGYQVSGYFEFKAKMSTGSLMVHADGPVNIKYDDGTEISFRFPKNKATGILMGSRKAFHEGVVELEDLGNSLKGVLVMNYGKK